MVMRIPLLALYRASDIAAVWSEHRASQFKAEHQVLGLPGPSIEPITFPCRADALYVMPGMWVNKSKVNNGQTYIILLEYSLY